MSAPAPEALLQRVCAASTTVPEPRTLCASFDERVVTVWQAHSNAVADAAVAAGRFGGRAWRTDRVTRFRVSLPSLLARNGWATRPGRERILAVHVSRGGFDALLRQAVHASFEPELYPSRSGWLLATRYANVTVAWHADVDPTGSDLPRQTVRFGVRDAALRELTSKWVVGVDDWTAWVVEHRDRATAATPVPAVARYPMSDDARARLAGRAA
ncbi:MAG: DUF4291 family protein [Myxococcota bacterium]